MSRANYQRVVLACTSCQHVFQPTLIPQVGQTGCERCGGWTWIAQLDPAVPPTPLPVQHAVIQSSDPVGEKQ